MSRYTYISAVGQQNNMACWAACLKWWYKADLSIHPSQNALWNRYKGMRDQLGGMTDSGIATIITENAMKCFTYTNPADFNTTRVASLLETGPIYVAFTEPGPDQKKHVNVIYELIGNGPWAEVKVMEPQAIENGDGTWTGKHQRRSLSDYNTCGTTYVGVNKHRRDQVYS
ncbi:MAG TPA: papain-like cysteine protease family protein [Pyrinomonadaceae bacterium]|nr:papain-like cysteine protease family protein [Pyrinomonadaceae bacterium]